MKKKTNIREYLFFATFGEIVIIIGAIDIGINSLSLIPILLILIGVLFKFISEETK